VKLILLGEGKRRGAIEALVAKRKLGDRVELAGHVNEVGAWLARANLLVSSSLWEGSPGVIIEAFEAGVPVVATACPGGSVELLEDGTGGMLVPVRNPAAMAAAIVTMLARPRDRNALRALARPFQDDGRADLAYLEAIDAAVRAKRAATPDRAPPLVSP
jgi:glycosyltransferase involved in cell wall biosynthesis